MKDGLIGGGLLTLGAVFGVIVAVSGAPEDLARADADDPAAVDSQDPAAVQDPAHQDPAHQDPAAAGEATPPGHDPQAPTAQPQPDPAPQPEPAPQPRGFGD